MKNLNLQIAENQTARILPFRIKSFKIQADEFEKILNHLQQAGYLLSRDMPLDWEDREIANRQIYDAIAAMKEIRKQGELKI
jgi:uncharacterized protein YpuA (DUF1002 family)